LLVLSGLLALPAAAQAAFPGKNGRIAFDTDGPAIEAVNPDGSGRALLAVPSPSERSNSPAWSADGAKFAFTGWSDVFTINADGTGQRSIPSDYDPHTVSWSPDGARLAFDTTVCGGHQCFSDIWLVNANGTGQTTLVCCANEPAWSPDGQRIAFSRVTATDPNCTTPGCQQLRDVFTVRPDGTDLKRLTHTTYPYTNVSPSW
jgi:Tol biopolymer transport system component